MGSSVSETVERYKKLYNILSPDNDSVSLTKELWKQWEQSGEAPPDINDIARNYAKFENGFFYDIVTIAERIEKQKLNIHYCSICLDKYNFYAFSAEDGYIVLADDYFLQLLFVLTVILIFDANGLVEEEERQEIRKTARQIIVNNYFHRQRFEFNEQSIIHTLLKRDFEIAEFANYFFNSLKLFIFSHEIGHHVLKHTSGSIKRSFGITGNTMTIDVDRRSIDAEFNADAYGYKLFWEVSNTVDENIYYAFCKYKFNFAPIFLFKLFEKLDHLSIKEKNEAIAYKTHPPPAERIQALIKQYQIDEEDPLYKELISSLDFLEVNF